MRKPGVHDVSEDKKGFQKVGGVQLCNLLPSIQVI